MTGALRIANGVDAPDTLQGPLSGNNSFVGVSLSDQSATPSAILFNFSATDNGYFFFESNSNADFVCFGPGGAGAFNGTCAIGVTSNVEAISLNPKGQNPPLTGAQIIASPEPASVILLAAGLSLGVFLRLRHGQPLSVS